MMRDFLKILAGAFVILVSVTLASMAASATAQTTTLAFGKKSHDTKQPVEIISDNFSLNQTDGLAEFVGHVVVGQGDMRLSADKINAEFTPAKENKKSEITKMVATGNVTLVSGTQAAEAQSAVYLIKEGTVVMEGNVLVTQGESTLSGKKMTIHLKDGSAKIEGRVKTVFQVGGTKGKSK